MADTTSRTTTERRQFFWSGRTLRCDVWVPDDVLGEHLDHTEDCLGVDAMRCVVAYEPYDKLIPDLLDKHFERQTHAE